MELKQYLAVAEKTYCALEKENSNNTYLLFGLTSTYLRKFIPTIIKDPSNTNKIMEIGGEIIWYLANYARLNNLRFAFYGTTPLDDLGSLLGQIIENHNRVDDAAGEINWEVCERNVQGVLSHFQEFYTSLGVTLREVLDMHANKLKLDFPEKFNVEVTKEK